MKCTLKPSQLWYKQNMVFNVLVGLRNVSGVNFACSRNPNYLALWFCLIPSLAALKYYLQNTWSICYTAGRCIPHHGWKEQKGISAKEQRPKMESEMQMLLPAKARFGDTNYISGGGASQTRKRQVGQYLWRGRVNISGQWPLENKQTRETLGMSVIKWRRENGDKSSLSWRALLMTARSTWRKCKWWRENGEWSTYQTGYFNVNDSKLLELLQHHSSGHLVGAPSLTWCGVL